MFCLVDTFLLLLIGFYFLGKKNMVVLVMVVVVVELAGLLVVCFSALLCSCLLQYSATDIEILLFLRLLFLRYLCDDRPLNCPIAVKVFHAKWDDRGAHEIVSSIWLLCLILCIFFSVLFASWRMFLKSYVADFSSVIV